MKKGATSKYVKKRVMYTVVTALILVITLGGMVYYIYQNAEREIFNELEAQTVILQENLSLQMISDQENLMTMARIASRMYEEEDGFQALLDAYKPIGLIDRICILTPEHILMTRNGDYDVSGMISFEEESEKGTCISGRVQDLLAPEYTLVRSAVPILVNDETVAILYGGIKLETIAQRYQTYLKEHDAWAFVVEQGNGNILVDTKRVSLGNIQQMGARKPKPGYSHEKMLTDIKTGTAGFTAYMSDDTEEYLYAYHMPLDVSDWHLILVKPESKAFAALHMISAVLTVVTVILIGIMGAYVIAMLNSEKKILEVNMNASRIRKCLLDMAKNSASIWRALEDIERLSHGQSAFYADSDGEQFYHVHPKKERAMLQGEDRNVFLKTVLSYIDDYRKAHEQTMTVQVIKADHKLRETETALYDFLKQHEIDSVCVSCTDNKRGSVCLLGVVNPRRMIRIRMLLEEISVCFSMAVFNDRYLQDMEQSALTDAMTGLGNRLAYNRALAECVNRQAGQFSAVYVDVNELHFINNVHGHAAGDAMLIYLSAMLKEFFPQSQIFRIGGDEFLVFSYQLDKNELQEITKKIPTCLEAKDYHASIGMAIRRGEEDTLSVIQRAERRMYEAKAAYYRSKEEVNTSELSNSNVEVMQTGNQMIDMMLPILSEHYLGIYGVKLWDDTARSVLVPSYFKRFTESKDSFSQAMLSYIREMVKPEYHRLLLNVLNYDTLRYSLQKNQLITVAYKKTSGDNIILKIHACNDLKEDDAETLWVFERVQELKAK